MKHSLVFILAAAIIALATSCDVYAADMINNNTTTETKIVVKIKDGEKNIIETIICRRDKIENVLSKCIVESSSSSLDQANIDKFVLQEFFRRTPMDMTKHSYCNWSGPQFFCCFDVCEPFGTCTHECYCAGGVCYDK